MITLTKAQKAHTSLMTSKTKKKRTKFRKINYLDRLTFKSIYTMTLLLIRQITYMSEIKTPKKSLKVRGTKGRLQLCLEMTRCP